MASVIIFDCNTIIGHSFHTTPNCSAAFPSALWCRWINFKLCHWRGAPLCSSVSVPTHPVCNIKCKSSLHWYPLSIQTNTKYKSLRLNMQGSSYRSEPSYYTFGNRRWPVFVRCYRERVKRAKCPQCVLDNTNVRLSPPDQVHHWMVASSRGASAVEYALKLAKWAKCSTCVKQGIRNAPDLQCSWWQPYLGLVLVSCVPTRTKTALTAVHFVTSLGWCSAVLCWWQHCKSIRVKMK